MSLLRTGTLRTRAKGITQIKILPSSAIIEGVRQLGKTPATVNRRTGVLYLNSDLINLLNEDQLFFVMLHEMAHVVLHNNNDDKGLSSKKLKELYRKREKEADDWAFNRYKKTGRSLTDSVLVLSKMFKADNHITGEEYERMINQLHRAQKADR